MSVAWRVRGGQPWGGQPSTCTREAAAPGLSSNLSFCLLRCSRDQMTVGESRVDVKAALCCVT